MLYIFRIIILNSVAITVLNRKSRIGRLKKHNAFGSYNIVATWTIRRYLPARRTLLPLAIHRSRGLLAGNRLTVYDLRNMAEESSEAPLRRSRPQRHRGLPITSTSTDEKR